MSGAQVLDVATGPGIVAAEAAERIGPSGSVLATDLVPEWVSSSRIRQRPLA